MLPSSGASRRRTSDGFKANVLQTCRSMGSSYLIVSEFILYNTYKFSRKKKYKYKIDSSSKTF